MVREVLTLNVGQCGIQLGAAVWEQYCAEHSIDTTGKKPNLRINHFYVFMKKQVLDNLYLEI